MHPRPYLSHSQLVAWESGPEVYFKKYIEGKQTGISRQIAFGKEIAEALENDEETGDFEKDLVIGQLPKYEIRDKSILMTLKVGKEETPILIKPDTIKEDYSAIREYKTGTTKWTQRMVDENDQLTFYATGVYIDKKFIPKLALDHAETEIDEAGRVSFTGNIRTFETERKMAQIINMMVRMRKAWKGIGEMCEKEII